MPSVVATGPTPQRDFNTVGSAIGQVLGAKIGQGVNRRRLERNFNPFLDAINAREEGTTAQQAALNEGLKNPQAFAFMQTAEGQQMLDTMATMNQAPVVATTVDRMVGGDTEIGRDLGLKPDERANVRFERDRNGNLIGRPSLVNPPRERKALQDVNAIVQGEQQATTLLFDPEAGTFTRTLPDGRSEEIPSSMISQVSIQGTREQVLPPTRADDIVAERDWLKYQAGELERMIGVIQVDPTIAGAGGTVRRFGQRVLGTVTSLGDFFGEAGAESASQFMLDTARAAEADVGRGTMDESAFNDLFNDPNISEMKLFENTLAYTLARLRIPSGRLLATVIRDSKEDASLTGLVGAEDVVNRLTAIQRQLTARRDSIDQRLNGPPQTPTTGDTGLPNAPTPALLTMEQLLDKYAPVTGQ